MTIFLINQSYHLNLFAFNKQNSFLALKQATAVNKVPRKIISSSIKSKHSANQSQHKILLNLSAQNVTWWWWSGIIWRGFHNRYAYVANIEARAREKGNRDIFDKWNIESHIVVIKSLFSVSFSSLLCNIVEWPKLSCHVPAFISPRVRNERKRSEKNALFALCVQQQQRRSHFTEMASAIQLNSEM